MSKTAYRMLLLLTLILAGAVIGYFSYNWFKAEFLLWVVLVSSPGLFGFAYAFLDKFREQLNSIANDIELQDIEIQRLLDAIQDSRRSMNQAFFFGLVAFSISISPCIVDKAGYIIPKALFIASTAASFSLIFLIWLFYDFGDEVHEFKIWLKNREREIKKQLTAMQQLNGDYQHRDSIISEAGVNDTSELLSDVPPHDKK